MAEMKAADEIIEQCHSRQEDLRAQFEQLKESMSALTKEEETLKDKMHEDEQVKKQLYTRCNDMKGRIKANREKYKKQKQEFGEIMIEEPPEMLNQ